MYRRGSLSLDRLLIYSDIYSLGLNQSDVDHLDVVFKAYHGVANFVYIYKPATPGYDLVLAIDDRNDPQVDIIQHAYAMDTAGYPAIHMQNIYLKFLPQIADLKLLKAAARFIPQGEFEDKNIVFGSMDEISKQIMNVELPRYVPDYNHPLDYPTIELLYMACGQPAPFLSILKKDYADTPEYVHHIVAVLTLPKDDTRIAFYVTKTRAYSGTFDLPLNFYTTKVGDPTYNWTDPDRYFSHLYKDTGRPTVFYTDANAVFPKQKDVIDSQRKGNNVITIDNATLDIIIKRWTRKQQDIENEKTAVKALERKIKDRITELDAGKEFSYNDVTFRKNEFEYEGQVISCNNIEMKDILGKFSGHYSEDHLNFDRVLDAWLHTLYDNISAKPQIVKGNIGDVAFEVSCKPRTAKNGIKAFIYRVNGHRINRDEVIQVLGRAICFPDTSFFDEFCDTVASCSLRYHKYLAGGILIKTHDEIFNQTIEFKIGLERVKNKNYIAMNGKRFKVADTNKLLSLLNSKGMVRVIDILLDPKIAGMDKDDIKLLLTTGRQALIDQRAKEDELLRSTMDLFGIEVIEDFTAQNGKTLDGYLVKGGIRNYVIEQEKLLVYEYPTGRYICMVDKGQNEHTNTTRLVNRFYALSNDSKLAKEISTL
jgi:hypothetical protein